jgi:hypothetical protein
LRWLPNPRFQSVRRQEDTSDPVHRACYRCSTSVTFCKCTWCAPPVTDCQYWRCYNGLGRGFWMREGQKCSLTTGAARRGDLSAHDRLANISSPMRRSSSAQARSATPSMTAAPSSFGSPHRAQYVAKRSVSASTLRRSGPPASTSRTVHRACVVREKMKVVVSDAERTRKSRRPQPDADIGNLKLALGIRTTAKLLIATKSGFHPYRLRRWFYFRHKIESVISTSTSPAAT